MSQVSHPTIAIRTQLRAHRVTVLAALMALAATAAVVLILAIDGGSPSSSVAGQTQPALRSDGGPNEAAVAAEVGSRPSIGSSESHVAASIGGGNVRPTGGPDESSVAASVSKSPQRATGGPNEAGTAAAISGR